MNTLTKKILIKKSDTARENINTAPDQTHVLRIEDIPVGNLITMVKETMMSSEELLQKKIQETPFIMKPWLKHGTLALIYANAGVGKTLCCLSIVTAITRKLPIGKWEVESPVGCLYIDAEMPTIDVQDRYKKLTKDLPDEKAPLHFLTSQEMFRRWNMTVDIVQKKWRDTISNILMNNPAIKLVVFDNISSLAPNINENSKREWDAINQWLISLRFMGVSVIALHHASAKGNPRGTTGRLDNLDLSIKLKEIDDGSGDGLANFEVRYTKKRSIYGKNLEPFCMKIAKDPDSGLPWTTSNTFGLNRRLYIVGLIGLGIKQKDIAEKLGCTEANVTQIKKKAIKEGIFNETGDPTEKWLETYEGFTAEDIINEYKEN